MSRRSLAATMVAHAILAPLVISYLRFSTQSQFDGDSEDRQEGDALRYCEAHGLTLDQSITDKGVSAYSGANVRKTSGLGLFLIAINTGKVPRGSILIVESLDRLSREKPVKAMNVLTSILLAGVTVVTTSNGRSYNEDSNTDLFEVLGLQNANHTSSKEKAGRIKSAWAKRRGTPSNLMPSWIRKTREIIVTELPGKPESRRTKMVITGCEFDPDKLAIVRRICCDLMLRMGYDLAAQTLNSENVPTLNGRNLTRSKAVWDASAIANIVRNRMVRGEQPIGEQRDGKRVLTGKHLSNAYPDVNGNNLEAITEAEWYAMQQAIDARAKGTNRMDGRKTGQMNNLFGDLARCSACGNRMTVMTRGKGTHLYYACSMGKQRKQSVCTAHRYHRLDKIERGAIWLLAQHALAQVEKSPDDPALLLQAELDTLIANTARLEADYETLFDQYGLKPDGSPERKALDKRSAQITDNHAAIKKLESAVLAKRVAKPMGDQFNALQALVNGLDGMPDAERIETRAKIAEALPSVVAKMLFDPDGDFSITMLPDLSLSPKPWPSRLVPGFVTTDPGGNLPSEKFRHQDSRDYEVTQIRGSGQQLFRFRAI